MSINDENIARWLEIEVSDEEEILNEDTSDVELDVAEDYVLQEDCEYDSEEQLTRPHMERRRTNEHILRDIRGSIGRILQVEEEIPSSSGADKLETRKTCSTCDRT
ncbi:unnamed protein product [Parnassius apollo]|uniref:(apollo) hypothetical protein n=2 Tax=Parnassius apollo TaxID=110799 RepID=A0A8S3WG12_PARAO|nr:unnamed protein product [Parnassius apollo]